MAFEIITADTTRATEMIIAAMIDLYSFIFITPFLLYLSSKEGGLIAGFN